MGVGRISTGRHRDSFKRCAKRRELRSRLRRILIYELKKLKMKLRFSLRWLMAATALVACVVCVCLYLSRRDRRMMYHELARASELGVRERELLCGIVPTINCNDTELMSALGLIWKQVAESGKPFERRLVPNCRIVCALGSLRHQNMEVYLIRPHDRFSGHMIN